MVCPETGLWERQIWWEFTNNEPKLALVGILTKLQAVRLGLWRMAARACPFHEGIHFLHFFGLSIDAHDYSDGLTV